MVVKGGLKVVGCKTRITKGLTHIDPVSHQASGENFERETHETALDWMVRAWMAPSFDHRFRALTSYPLRTTGDGIRVVGHSSSLARVFVRRHLALNSPQNL